MNIMKVIFLDIDGVLNSWDDYNNRCKNLKKEERPTFGDIEERSLMLLKELIEATNAKVVLSSSWRKSIFLTSEVYKALSTMGIELYDITPILPSGNRADEIKDWLKDKEIESFVILDDDSFEFKGNELCKHLVKTTMNSGLQKEHVEKAIRILNQWDYLNEAIAEISRLSSLYKITDVVAGCYLCNYGDDYVCHIIGGECENIELCEHIRDMEQCEKDKGSKQNEM